MSYSQDKNYRLKDFCKVGDGTHSSIAREDDGVMYLTSKNFKPNGLDLTKLDYISEANFEKHFEKSKTALVKPVVGDIVFGIIGSIGTPYVVKRGDRFGISSSVGILRPMVEIDSYFLYYYMTSSSFQSAVDGMKSGAAQGFLSLEMIKNLPLLKLDIKVQHKIAAILSAYDDLIENNKGRIALLENMAEEIYREWFVRFRFPGYKTAEFEKGIPKGWSLERIDCLGKLTTGKTPSTTNSKYYGGEIPFVKTPDMHGNMFVFETEELLTEDGLNSQPSQILDKNAICVSCIGTGGVVSMTTQRCSTNQQINSLSLNTASDREWAFFTLKALKPTILAFGATGATMTNLSKGKFAGIRAIIPNKELRLEFSTIINPMFEQIQFLSMLNKNLNTTKASLLPRLISGKLSVEDLDIQFPLSMQEENAA